jgi:hypothetical protein
MVIFVPIPLAPEPWTLSALAMVKVQFELRSSGDLPRPPTDCGYRQSGVDF